MVIFAPLLSYFSGRIFLHHRPSWRGGIGAMLVLDAPHPTQNWLNNDRHLTRATLIRIFWKLELKMLKSNQATIWGWSDSYRRLSEATKKWMSEQKRLSRKNEVDGQRKAEVEVKPLRWRRALSCLMIFSFFRVATLLLAVGSPNMHPLIP